MTSDQDKNAKQILEKVGMQVYTPTAAQIGEFRKLAQPPVKAVGGEGDRQGLRRQPVQGDRRHEEVSPPVAIQAIDIVSIGEPMVEFNQTPARRSCSYLQGFGGDSSNMIIAAARHGARTAYVTRLGDDEFGRMFLGAVDRQRASTRAASRSIRKRTPPSTS